MAEPATDAGQAAGTGPEGATGAAPSASDGQSATPSQTTQKGSSTGSEESFFDVKSIENNPELMKAYKQMQGDYSKKMGEIRGIRNDADLYRQIMQDPQGAIRQYAQQFGMTVVDGKPTADGDGEFNPKSWNEVVQHIKQEARDELTSEFAPVMDEVKNLKRQSIEQRLDSDFPDWRQYEGQMVDMLSKHPTLVSDPETLYEMSIPPKLRQQRAYEAAMAKIRGEQEASQVNGANRTTQDTGNRPNGPLTIAEAAKLASAQLRAKGIKP